MADPGGGGPAGSAGASGSGDHSGGAGSASGANDPGRGFDGLGDSRSQGGFDNSVVGQNTKNDKGLFSGIASLFGIDPTKSFTQNALDMAIPGRNTPFGALGLLAGPLGLGQNVGLAMGLGNLASNLADNTQSTDVASAPSTVGQDAVAELAMDMQNVKGLDQNTSAKLASALNPSTDVFSNENPYGNVTQDILSDIVNERLG